MMMKKTRRTVTAIALAAITLTGLAACGEGRRLPAVHTVQGDDAGFRWQCRRALYRSEPAERLGRRAQCQEHVLGVSDNNAHKATLYDGNGVVQPLVVTIPDGTNGPLRSDRHHLQCHDGLRDQRERQVEQRGLHLGDGRGHDRGMVSQRAADRSRHRSLRRRRRAGGGLPRPDGCATVNGQNMLYAADSTTPRSTSSTRRSRRSSSTGSSRTPTLPGRPASAPFGIQTIGSSIFVTLREAERGSGRAGRRRRASAFSTSSTPAVASSSSSSAWAACVNAPWGVAQAPASFGPLSNQLLVGNFGDGTIEAFDPTSGHDLGKLVLSDGKPFTQAGIVGDQLRQRYQQPAEEHAVLCSGAERADGRLRPHRRVGQLVSRARHWS